MKLKAQKLYFPDNLLPKIRAQVLADASAGLRVTKNLGTLLSASQGLCGGPNGSLLKGQAELEERENKDQMRFYSEALKAAENKRSMAEHIRWCIERTQSSSHVRAAHE